MPTPNSNDVWSKFSENKFDDIVSYIKKDGTLVNTVNENNSSLLSLALLGSKSGDERQKLLEVLVSHPQMKWDHKKTNDSGTNVESLVNAVRKDLFALVAQNPQFLTNENKSTYALGEKLIARDQKLLVSAEKRSTSKRCQELRDHITALKEFMKLVRDATILHAIKTDDPALLSRLDDAKGDPTGDMTNGARLNKLITTAQPKLRSWLKQRSDTHFNNMAQNPNSFYNKGLKIKTLEADMQKLKKEHLTEKTNLNAQKIDAMKEFLEDAQKDLNRIKV